MRKAYTTQLRKSHTELARPAQAFPGQDLRCLHVSPLLSPSGLGLKAEYLVEPCPEMNPTPADLRG